MAEPVKRRFDPKLVDESYVAPTENATPGETLKGQLAAAKREGRRLQKLEHDKASAIHVAHVTGIKSAHVDELNRSGHVLAVGNRWRGRLEGVIIGGLLMLAAGAVLLGQSFEQARQYGAGMVAVGAATQAAAPPSTCIPGETLDDGRRCPMTTDQRVGN